MSLGGSDWSVMVATAVCAENNSEAANSAICTGRPIFIRHLLASDALVISKESATRAGRACDDVDAKLSGKYDSLECVLYLRRRSAAHGRRRNYERRFTGGCDRSGVPTVMRQATSK